MQMRSLMKVSLVSMLAVAGLAPMSVAEYIVRDYCPVGGQIEFYWTQDGVQLPPPIVVTTPGWHTFSMPPPGANDWHQTVTDATGKSTVYAGSFVSGGSGWEYGSGFEILPAPPWRIPDPIPIIPLPGDNELYAAVNLGVYLTDNPWPAIGIGDIATISNGEIAGLNGVVFSSTEPVFDSQAPLGWGNITPFTGDALVVSVHSSVPEPATAALLALGCLLTIGCRTRRRGTTHR